jgi:ABC-type transport system substrate-binding protein
MEKDKNKRKELLQNALDLLMEESPLIPLYYLSNNYLCSEKVHNIVVSPLGYVELKWAYIE